MIDWDKDWQEVYSSFEVTVALGKMSYQIRSGHQHPEIPLVLVPILKGGVWTAYQLLDRLSSHVEQCPDIRIGHMGISSYGNDRTPGKMKHTSTLDLDTEDFRGADVWIIDDIWDTGDTMGAAFERLSAVIGSLNTAVLVHRRQFDSLDAHPTVAGFIYDGPEFLAGCGMGIGELHRHHPSIYAERTLVS